MNPEKKKKKNITGNRINEVNRFLKKNKSLKLLCVLLIIFILLCSCSGFIIFNNFTRTDNAITRPFIFVNNIFQSITVEPTIPEIGQNINITILINNTILTQLIKLQLKAINSDFILGTDISLKPGNDKYLVNLGIFSQPQQIWIIIIANTNNSFSYLDTIVSIGYKKDYFIPRDSHFNQNCFSNRRELTIFSNFSVNSSYFSTYTIMNFQYKSNYIQIEYGQIFASSIANIKIKNYNETTEISSKIVLPNKKIFILEKFSCLIKIQYFLKSNNTLTYQSCEEYHSFISPTISINI